MIDRPTLYVNVPTSLLLLTIEDTNKLYLSVFARPAEHSSDDPSAPPPHCHHIKHGGQGSYVYSNLWRLLI